MGFNFPDAPTIGQLHPDPAQVGIPQYQWNGTEWVTPEYDPLDYVRKSGDTMTGALLLHANATAALQAVPKQQLETYAAPFDAMAYSGMQVNGGMEVNQQYGHNNPGTSGYVADQWGVSFIGTMTGNVGTYSSPLLIDPFVGFPNYLGMNIITPQASLGANDYAVVYQFIEGYRVARLEWGTVYAKPVTISFWCKHGTAGIHSLTVRNGINDFSYATTYTQNVANAAEYKTITIPGPTTGTWYTDNRSGIDILFAAACGTNFIVPSVNTWVSGNYLAAPGQVNGVAATGARLRLTGVIVLPGTQAPTAAQSAYAMRSHVQELPLCQRYWVKVGLNVFDTWQAAGVNFFGNIYMPVSMRTIPTVAYDTISYVNANTLLFNSAGYQTVMSRALATSSGYCYCVFNAAMNARI